MIEPYLRAMQRKANNTMHNYNTHDSEQVAWYHMLWQKRIYARVPMTACVAAIIAFFTAVGQPDTWHWFLVLFALTTPALLLILWLMGEVVIAAIVFVKEWREVFTSDL
jgi:hypothetical protein